MNLENKLFKQKPLNDFLKRLVDLIAATCGLIILSPVLVSISIIIKFTSPGPIFFKQIRVGKNEKYFEILKFRTMVVDAEKLGKQITVGKDPRITGIGHILREYKLDELPQLINVFIGNMSLVGPRPEVPKYTKLYSDVQKNVLKVKPGITDYASIKYSNENEILSNSENPEETYIHEVMQDKLKINLEYIQRRSVLEDLKIILLTFAKIVK